MHTRGAQVLKSVHPAAKICTQGAVIYYSIRSGVNGVGESGSDL